MYLQGRCGIRQYLTYKTQIVKKQNLKHFVLGFVR